MAIIIISSVCPSVLPHPKRPITEWQEQQITHGRLNHDHPKTAEQVMVISVQKRVLKMKMQSQKSLASDQWTAAAE